MIVLVGIPTEGPIALVHGELEALGADVVVLNQRRFAETRVEIEIEDGRLGGLLGIGRRVVPLAAVTAAYVRPMAFGDIPEVRALAPADPVRAAGAVFDDLLHGWLESTPARVVNRSAPQASNGSKPLQAQLIREAGFDVPETLVTSDPDAALAFRDLHGRVIYKSASGARSIVSELRDDDLPRLGRLRWCPVQFQRLVPGRDVRVHCVGGEVFATAIDTTGTDYRYAGDGTTLTAFALPDGLAERALDLTARLRLEFSGIDLRLGPDGEAWCFEVNPSPGFSYYEEHTGQPIARAVARHLLSAAR